MDPVGIWIEQEDDFFKSAVSQFEFIVDPCTDGLNDFLEQSV